MRSTVDRIRSAGRGARRAADRADELWEQLAASVRAIPEREYERRRRAGRLRGHSTDSTHPPTRLRRERLLTVEPARAGGPACAGRERRIAAELADVCAEVARRIVRDGFDTTA
ncbi:hypothetical protein ACF1DW_23940 [Streptomyces sp. NPDC014603]|uniref:Uncharacterized protein n=2 Tax=unclassified Streptomyces TaxID=2593676 RepID=A0A6G3R486_9ACTN|nr:MULTISPECIES: hypothetical protein [unclassified Streptomyces]NEA90247.1 hypothetical protein [Streptomyces sp. SID14436]NEC82434.1 hypothetical protein [Streptomyces sp. SID7958]